MVFYLDQKKISLNSIFFFVLNNQHHFSPTNWKLGDQVIHNYETGTNLDFKITIILSVFLQVGRYSIGNEDIRKMFDFSADRVEKSVDDSLKLLGVDYIDLVQVHDIEFAPSLDIILKETLPALQKVSNLPLA